MNRNLAFGSGFEKVEWKSTINGVKKTALVFQESASSLIIGDWPEDVLIALNLCRKKQVHRATPCRVFERKHQIVS
jgi:hypothetical protein